MVRSVVGLSLDIGLGKRRPADVAKALRARNRNAVGPVASAKGLHLVLVGYRPSPFERVDPTPSPR
jgi:tRNA pseudouridine38-40 synthase